MSDNEREHVYDQFKMSQLTKGYVFKVGMDFKSLTKFKDAIREWSVLNGTEFKFVKMKKKGVGQCAKKNVVSWPTATKWLTTIHIN